MQHPDRPFALAFRPMPRSGSRRGRGFGGKVSRAEPGRPLYRYWQPRYWPIWLGLAVLRLVCLLPYRSQLATGRALGRVLQAALRRRRRVAEANLQLCFPELGVPERAALCRRHFESLGMNAVEIGMSLWFSDAAIDRLVRVSGTEHIDAARARQAGVILLSGHFAAIEICARGFQARYPELAALYRRMANPLVDELLRRSRSGGQTRLIPKDDMRQLVRTLRQGIPVWYAPDQSHRRRYSVLAPFFGEPAMTNTALTELVRMGGAAVIPCATRRLPDGAGYEVVVLPEVRDLPLDDAAACARRVNAILESLIRRAPEQYYWIHRRFKGRPAPYPDPYASG